MFMIQCKLNYMHSFSGSFVHVRTQKILRMRPGESKVVADASVLLS